MPTFTALQPRRSDTPHDGARSLPQGVPAGTWATAPAVVGGHLAVESLAAESLHLAPPGAVPHGAAPQAGSPHIATPASLPCWPSQELLGRGVEALIRHGDALYRLRLTRQGKLILTK